MSITVNKMEPEPQISNNNDRINDLKAFDERKTGVKGLVDEGTQKIPSIFVRPKEERSNEYSTCHEKLTIPVIDLAGINEENGRAKIISEVLGAFEEWGFFQVVNHGVPLLVLDKMTEAALMFHEQDDSIKMELYTRDDLQKVKYFTNYDFHRTTAANWRDTFQVNLLHTGLLDPQELPSVCRDATLDYIDQTLKLGELLLELISMALGLKLARLHETECMKGWNFACQYYPACPEPDLTLGINKHTDPSFITILLQNHILALQVLHQEQWVDVDPIPGAFIVIIGDYLQAVSNGKFKSVDHRAIANKVGPRISIALFIAGLFSSPIKYGPIKELLSEENPPIYKDFTSKEVYDNFMSATLSGHEIGYLKLPTATNDILPSSSLMD